MTKSMKGNAIKAAALFAVLQTVGFLVGHPLLFFALLFYVVVLSGMSGFIKGWREAENEDKLRNSK